MEDIDINNNKTVTSSPTELLKINILIKRQEALDVIEKYYEYDYSGAQPPEHKVRAKIKTLFNFVRASFKRDKTENEYNAFLRLMDDKDIKKVLEAFEQLDDWMDEKKLIRFDNVRSYDSTNVEIENEAKSL